MAFWDWFRKKAKKIEEVSSEEVKVDELENWLRNKKNELEKQEESFLNIIQERINQLIQELEDEISVLKRVKIEEKKVEEKIKLIVKENLENYVAYLEKLIEKLKEVKGEKNVIEKINSIFPDFEKKSRISFEKATFLIGKEMADVKDSIRNFFRDLEKILKENKELIDKSKIIFLVETEIEKVNKTEKIKSEIEKIIKNCDNKIKSLEENVKTKKKEIEEIQKSEEFIEEEKKKEMLVEKKEELEKEIYNLREMIDFKSLANFFHSFQKEMDIIKAYKENFENAFQRDNGEDIFGLLKEAKLQDRSVLDKIEEIIEKKKEINNTIIKKTGTETVEEEIRKIEAEIELLNSKKFIEGKKYRKLELNSQEIIGLIKGELTKMNVKVN